MKEFKFGLIQGILLVLDIASVLVAIFGSLFLRFNGAIESGYMNNAFVLAPIMIVVTVVVLYYFRLYHSLWEYASITELSNVINTAVISSLILIAGSILISRPLPRSCYIIYFILLVMFLSMSRFSYRFLRVAKRGYLLEGKSPRQLERVMIIGAGDAGEKVLREIVSSDLIYKEVVCFIDGDSKKIGSNIHGVPVVGNRDYIMEAVEKYDIEEILVAMPSVSKLEIANILAICKETKKKIKVLPFSFKLKGDVHMSDFKEVEIKDLLGREEIKVNLSDIMGYVSDKVVMVTGGGGSIGSELCRQIAAANPRQLIIVDIYENNAYEIQMELLRKYPKLNLVALIASVRNTTKVDDIFKKYKPDIVYHAAAHKHVPLMETSPNEAVKNNVFGTLNVAKAADKYHVKRMILISTDKAVNPTNVMGATKRICEMIIQTINKQSETEYVAVRFGNVLGSNGSVIPLFKKQIAEGGPVTVTDKNIIRYFMTIPEAVSLVLQAGAYAKGGEIFILDMGEPVKIDDLARNLIKLSGLEPDVDIPVVYTGLRPGEKLYEELLMNEEGLQDTPNKLIHIGKPIELDEENFFNQLKDLKTQAYKETNDMRGLIQDLVPTYHPNMH